jgi:excinuclease UvrABC ATPase subunit
VTKTKKDGTVLERVGAPISATSSTQIVDASWGAGGAEADDARARGAGKKGFHRDVLEDLSQAGVDAGRVNGEIKDLRDVLKEPGENPLKLGRYEKHTIDAVIDRLALAAPKRGSAWRSRGARAIWPTTGGGDRDGRRARGPTRPFSTKFADPDHPEIALEELAPRTVLVQLALWRVPDVLTAWARSAGAR